MKFGMNFTAHIDQRRPEKVLAALWRSVDFGATRIERRSKYFCPIDTGTLKRSIEITDIPGGKGIGPDTDYDVYVEFGTKRTSAQPYMRPALYENRKPIADRIAGFVREALK